MCVNEFSRSAPSDSGTNPTPHLFFFPHQIKVVLSTSFSPSTHVSVICGGGSGHEPFATGYVGPGLLSAAVAGPTFASPPASAVRAAIHAVTDPQQGCLVLVMNYTGDRLQFGAAVEGARAAGLPVEVVTMGDDVALLPPGGGGGGGGEGKGGAAAGDPAYAKARAGARGIGGNMMVLKIAGAAAALGKPLAEVAAAARAAAAAVSSMGVATCPCAMPGADRPDRLGLGMMELGMGLHGEPGAAVVPVAGGAGAAVEAVVAALLDRGPVAAAVRAARAAGRPPPRLACLVNSLGGSAVLEVGAVTAAVLAELTGRRGLPLERLYSGVFASSLDMRGFSVSLLLLEGGGGGGGGGGGDFLPVLDYPVDVAAPWPASPAVVGAGKAAVPLPSALVGALSPRSRGPPPDSPSVAAFTAALAAAAAAIKAAAPRLDALDARAGDGDCGATLAAGADALEAALAAAALDLATPQAAAQSIGAALAGMGGTSGGLYSLFLASAAGALPAGWEATAAGAWAGALAAGAAAISEHAGASAGDRTMLDALLPAAAAAAAAATSGAPGPAVAAAAAAAAEAGAAATSAMAGGAGRAAYVPAEAVRGEPDPGAIGVATWLRGVAGELGVRAA